MTTTEDLLSFVLLTVKIIKKKHEQRQSQQIISRNISFERMSLFSIHLVKVSMHLIFTVWNKRRIQASL